MPIKGESIRFVKGKYAGYDGWRDKSKKTKRKSIYRYVIVALEDGHEHPTRVKLTSFRKPLGQPRNYEEAALQQYEDMELAMIRLCEMLAQTGIQATTGAMHLFEEELNHAIATQHKLGNRGGHRPVNFN